MNGKADRQDGVGRKKIVDGTHLVVVIKVFMARCYVLQVINTGWHKWLPIKKNTVTSLKMLLLYSYFHLFCNIFYIILHIHTTYFSFFGWNYVLSVSKLPAKYMCEKIPFYRLILLGLTLAGLRASKLFFVLYTLADLHMELFLNHFLKLNLEL